MVERTHLLHMADMQRATHREQLASAQEEPRLHIV
jgi:hypothetical protein